MDVFAAQHNTLPVIPLRAPADPNAVPKSAAHQSSRWNAELFRKVVQKIPRK